MSAEEKNPTAIVEAAAPAAGTDTANDTDKKAGAPAAEAVAEQERAEKIRKAKELYSHGSRNFLVKCYSEAADELSEVCAIYDELYGELSDELGMPYLLYAKSLIALALDENKVIDVPDVADDDDDDDEDAVEGAVEAESETGSNGAPATSTNGKNVVGLMSVEEATCEEADKTDEADSSTTAVESVATESGATTDVDKTTEPMEDSTQEKEQKKSTQETQVSSSNDDGSVAESGNGVSERPSTSNGEAGENGEPTGEPEEEENETASSLQLAWEILELAAKIFSRQGISGLANLAEVQTELANIEFENNILDAAREDYEKALKIYQELPTNYRRAMAEINYKIGLTFLMQQMNLEGAASLKEACQLIEGEIEEIKQKAELSEKDRNNIQDMEETQQEIWAKIAEIEETQALNAAEVRAALDSYIKPITSQSADGAACSSSSAAASSSNVATSSKPTDISHLIKRKKPEEPSSEAEAASSPAKRPAL